MNKNARHFLDKTLGEDFFSLFGSLSKSEIYHPNSRTVSDIADIANGLKIVPRVIMAFLIKELVPMELNESKQVEIPVPGSPKLNVTKIDNNAYSGSLEKDNKKTVDFVSRTIPSLGIVIMSSYELYDIDGISDPIEDEDKGLELKLQQMIDERFAVHSLIGKIVDNKISERDAIQQLVLAKLTEKLNTIEPIMEVKPEMVKQKKELPLKDFIDNHKNKQKEFSVKLYKSDCVNCPDCGKQIFANNAYSGCICFGDDQSGKIFVKKSETGVKIRFGAKWDIENIEMLLEVLRSKNGH